MGRKKLPPRGEEIPRKVAGGATGQVKERTWRGRIQQC